MTLPRHRQTPEPIQIFKGSAHGKLNDANPERPVPMLHWCHILAQSLHIGTQFPENFLMGSPQTNAAMLLFELLIPKLLEDLHKKLGPDSNPQCFLEKTFDMLSHCKMPVSVVHFTEQLFLEFVEKVFENKKPPVLMSNFKLPGYNTSSNVSEDSGPSFKILLPPSLY